MKIEEMDEMCIQTPRSTVVRYYYQQLRELRALFLFCVLLVNE